LDSAMTTGCEDQMEVVERGGHGVLRVAHRAQLNARSCT
jgi:hypothetical protein